MRDSRRALWMVVLADVLLTYPVAFAAEAWMGGSEGPSAPTSYRVAQPWVYALIAPVAGVAAWRGARQVADAWAGRARWWRLPLEGAATGVALALLIGAPLGATSDLAPAVRDAALLAGGLGAALTCINLPLARLLRPGTRSGVPPAQAERAPA